MNFSRAIAAMNSAERDRLIAAEVAAYGWLDHVAKQMEHGGWPENAAPRIGHIEADDSELRVRVLIDYTELSPQGCNAYPRHYVDTATALLTINRRNGAWAMTAEA